jgi:hypothetical protein
MLLSTAVWTWVLLLLPLRPGRMLLVVTKFITRKLLTVIARSQSL